MFIFMRQIKIIFLCMFLSGCILYPALFADYAGASELSGSDTETEIDSLKKEIQGLKKELLELKTEFEKTKTWAGSRQQTHFKDMQEVVVSADDDPFKGDIKAPLTII